MRMLAWLPGLVSRSKNYKNNVPSKSKNHCSVQFMTQVRLDFNKYLNNIIVIRCFAMNLLHILSQKDRGRTRLQKRDKRKKNGLKSHRETVNE